MVGASMASPSRIAEREEERRFNIRTLAIASAASAAAAVVTSRLWFAGTWVAAALTPVLVALISEMLHRPTEKIAGRLTTDRPALAEAAGPAPPADPDADKLPDRAPAEPGAGRPPRQPGAPGPVRVYRTTASPRRRRRIAYGAVFGTAALALAIAVFALTVPELIAGGSIGKNDGRTTFSSRDRDRNSNDRDGSAADTTEQQQPTQTNESEQPRQTEEQTTPEETTTTTTPEEQTTPTTPQRQQTTPVEPAPAQP
jgi:hypothetical protein